MLSNIRRYRGSMQISASELNDRLKTTGLLYHVIENESQRKIFVAPHITKILSASFLHDAIETKGVYSNKMAVLIDPEKVKFIGYGPCDLHSGDQAPRSYQPPNGIDYDDFEYMKWRLDIEDEWCKKTTSEFTIDTMKKLEREQKVIRGTDLHESYNECVVELEDRSAILAVVPDDRMISRKREMVKKDIEAFELPKVKLLYDAETKSNSITSYLNYPDASLPSQSTVNSLPEDISSLKIEDTVTQTVEAESVFYHTRLTSVHFKDLMECTNISKLKNYLKNELSIDKQLPQKVDESDVSKLKVLMNYGGSTKIITTETFCMHQRYQTIHIWNGLDAITFYGMVRFTP